ncbi:LuxR C-terminal-related transcriptional regulator [Streptomyces sp. NBC_01142]|uniref:helix-turn-helix transcriptional regulator n=1 Tax=Streptomyces sp. NBC_01142 TaxID=2975865 RepID=UPI00225B59A6|nr:LuxR C-terminal-related transcriptional regulator [Streptomyces sp. NBC_01142]MCX4825327.1 LuxR C-terminal-related transcriptional regulator [Streptomyces sp. NBC_01142]
MSTLSDAAWQRWLQQALAHAAQQPALLLVEGGAGIGKSRLVHRLLEAAEAGSRPRVIISFTSSGVTLAHHPVPAARPEAGAAAISGRAGREPPPAPPRIHPDATALAAELAPLLESGSPVLLVAEDVHRADRDSQELLRRLLERPPAGLAAVLAYRPEELDLPGLVLGRAVSYPARLSVLRLRLAPLDAEQVRQVVEELLGAECCPPELVARIHERSGGVPQVVIDLVRQLEDVYGPKERYTARDVDATGPPVRLAELVLGRLAALSEEQSAVVRAAAVLDEPAGAEDLYAVAALPAEEGRPALVAALRGAVLQENDRDMYGFPSPLAGTAVYQELPGPVRQAMHRRAAEVLAHRQPVPWARLAVHRQRGGQLRAWLRSVEQAALHCAEAGEHQTAIDLLEQALSHPAVPQQVRARLAPLLAHSAVLALHTEQTVQVLRQILDDDSLPAAVRGRIRLDLGLVLYNQAGMGLQGWVELEQAVEELEEKPPLAARAMSALAMPVMSSVPLERNLHWLERARSAAAATGDAEVRTAVAANCIAVLLETGDPSAWDVLDRLRGDADDNGRLQHVARGLINAADAALWLGYVPHVGDLLEEGRDLAARSGASYVEQDGRGSSLLLDWATGRWEGLAGRARAFVAEAGVMPGPAADARIVLGLLALAQGEWQQMAAWLSGDGHPLPVGSPLPHSATASGALIRTALARDDLETAAAEAATAWDRLRDKGVWAWAAELAPWAVEATARAGRRKTAQEMVAEFEAGLKGRMVPSAEAALHWSRGVLIETEGDPAQAEPHFRRAAAMYAAMPRPYAAILTTEAAARCALSSGGDADAAVEELASCVRQLSDLGAGWDAARVRATLRAHQPVDAPRPRGRPSYGDQLSPREQEVIDLASAGLTNREIAATLHLSPRTVEQHVSRARRKLESQSRQELSRARTERAR